MNTLSTNPNGKRTRSIPTHPIALLWMAMSIAVGTSACKDDEDAPPPSPVNEEELITAVHLYLVPTGGGDTAVLSFTDPDGSGGVGPTYDWDTLPQSTVFNGWVRLFNGSTDVTPEVQDEDTEHQFFYANVTGGLQWTGYADVDANGYPVGINTTWSTGGASGEISVKLIHQPDKGAAGVSNGDPANAGGSTDVNVGLFYAVQ